MPQRTNSFQELVTLIQEALAPRGATVTASAMVPSPTSGRMREIDVLVDNGPQAMKIAVEAKDEGRKFDVGKLEAIIGKYFGPGSLPVGRVVVVTHRGFTSEAITRAKDVGIQLFTLAEAKTADWRGLFPTESATVVADPFAIDLKPYPELPPGFDNARVFHEGRMIVLDSGQDLGRPIDIMAASFRKVTERGSPFLQMMRERAQQNGGVFEYELKLQFEKQSAIRVDGVDWPFERATILVRCICSTELQTLTAHTMAGEEGDTRVVHTRGDGLVNESLMPIGAENVRGVVRLRADMLMRMIGPEWLRSLRTQPDPRMLSDLQRGPPAHGPPHGLPRVIKLAAVGPFPPGVGPRDSDATWTRGSSGDAPPSDGAVNG